MRKKKVLFWLRRPARSNDKARTRSLAHETREIASIESERRERMMMQGVVVACGGEKRFGNLVTQVRRATLPLRTITRKMITRKKKKKRETKTSKPRGVWQKIATLVTSLLLTSIRRLVLLFSLLTSPQPPPSSPLSLFLPLRRRRR